MSLNPDFSVAAAAAVASVVSDSVLSHRRQPFGGQENWSGLVFPSPMHESEKWEWSRSVVSNSSQPHGLQPTRLLRPWHFPGKCTGVGCHCLLQTLVLLLLLLLSRFSRVRLFTTPWTAAYQAPPSMAFSRQEYWSGVPLPSPLWLSRTYLFK